MTIKKEVIEHHEASTHEPTTATTLFTGPIGDASSNGGNGGGVSASSSQDGSDEDHVIEAVVGDNGTITTESSSSTLASMTHTTSSHKPSFSRMPSNKGSRFGGGLAGIVEASVASSMEQNLGNWTAPFTITAKDLGELSSEPSRVALADVLYKGVINMTEAEVLDEETPSPTKKLQQDVLKLTKEIRAAEENPSSDPKAALEAEKNADIAANVLTSVLLRSSPESGIDPREVEHRKEVFGTNALSSKKLDSYLKLCYEAVQDFVLMMLIVLGIISIIIEVTTTLGKGEKCTTCWIEGAAILVSVIIVVNVTAGIDYAKQFAFLRLTRSLHDTNTKSVIRDGLQVTVIDDDIVVGDILSVNSHNLASIPADCVMLGPVGGSELHMDESALTGESKAIKKRPGDVVLSGTHAIQGSAKLVVIAVGVNSVSGKIRARVYETGDHESELDDEGENSPLFVKLDIIAKRIGIAGTVAATVSFLASLIIGLGIEGDPPSDIVTYLVTAITVLAVAVPEGLPLAVTLALAFSSNKMTKDMNLVKHLDACETMGCATTICTDKTGTLTANKMTCRALYAGGENYLVEDPAESLGGYVKRQGAHEDIIELICRCIAVDTMNETVLYYASDGKNVEGSSGNPTEVALLQLVHDLGSDFNDIRNSTKGRSDQGMLGMYLNQGKHIEFTSARKIMSWAVPMDDGTYRLFCKGAQEVVVARCSSFVDRTGERTTLTDDSREEVSSVALAYSRRGMRCLGLAYRDLPADFDWESTSNTIMNSDGTPALLAETEMSLLALVGIEDPLRQEVPGAIEKCYAAGIDVRMVTGDNPNTAVSIAYQAGIIRDFHFKEGTTERVASNLKENVLMEGKTFRSKVYRLDEEGKKEFDQAAFDKIWPRLRVLARSSPDDKLTLAHGLNQSNLFADKEFCRMILETEGIAIFPDRQVVAMTGDGTNDAPALKRADIGFAMGISGTQIAKDAADIILLDDNFASIVTAAKWGRNVYASIQKFLQFQLTVNISAVITALVGSLAYQQSPLAAIQLLWVNLLMDSLASVALASEPPTEALLQRPPVNRTDSMITKRMLANMLGQATYQVAVVMTLLFAGPTLFDIPPGNVYEKETDGENSLHYTIIFNSFVWMQLFNEVNSRKLKGEFNVFEGVLSNPYFCGIWVVTSGLQALIVQYGSIAFHVYAGGLPGKYWGISMALGLGSFPVQQIINFIYKLSKKYKGYRIKKRVKRNARQATRQVEAGGLSSERPVVSHEKKKE